MIVRDLERIADEIVSLALAEASPREAVMRALADSGRDGAPVTHLLAIGKAAPAMARAALDALPAAPRERIVITKYGHLGTVFSAEELAEKGLRLFEAGHPVPDEASVRATEAALEMADRLGERDHLLFLVSGGGSALFEKPRAGVTLEALRKLTGLLLARGAGIREINAIRKHLSEVKGGAFARRVAPARITQILLSDVLGDPPDAIASGPAAPDSTTEAEARALLERYAPEFLDLPMQETAKSLERVSTRITGSVRSLCRSAEKICAKYGIEATFLTDSLDCEAAEAGRFLAAISRSHRGRARAYICGGETVVRLRGKGKGGRNQELCLAASEGLAEHALLFSLGSDGSDGPTDAAGAKVTAETWRKIADPRRALEENDSYPALDQAGALLRTGPTGTNVNDLTVLLLADREEG